MKANQNTAWPGNISPHLQASYYLEARVGIGRLMPCLRLNNMPFLQQMQTTLALPEPTESNSSTEGFTEGWNRLPKHQCGIASLQFSPSGDPCQPE
jgi:hypothetical protein